MFPGCTCTIDVNILVEVYYFIALEGTILLAQHCFSAVHVTVFPSWVALRSSDLLLSHCPTTHSRRPTISWLAVLGVPELGLLSHGSSFSLPPALHVIPDIVNIPKSKGCFFLIGVEVG